MEKHTTKQRPVEGNQPERLWLLYHCCTTCIDLADKLNGMRHMGMITALDQYNVFNPVAEFCMTAILHAAEMPDGVDHVLECIIRERKKLIDELNHRNEPVTPTPPAD